MLFNNSDIETPIKLRKYSQSKDTIDNWTTRNIDNNEVLKVLANLKQECNKFTANFITPKQNITVTQDIDVDQQKVSARKDDTNNIKKQDFFNNLRQLQEEFNTGIMTFKHDLLVTNKQITVYEQSVISEDNIDGKNSDDDSSINNINSGIIDKSPDHICVTNDNQTADTNNKKKKKKKKKKKAKFLYRFIDDRSRNMKLTEKIYMSKKTSRELIKRAISGKKKNTVQFVIDHIVIILCFIFIFILYFILENLFHFYLNLKKIVKFFWGVLIDLLWT